MSYSQSVTWNWPETNSATLKNTIKVKMICWYCFSFFQHYVWVFITDNIDFSKKRKLYFNLHNSLDLAKLNRMMHIYLKWLYTFCYRINRENCHALEIRKSQVSTPKKNWKFIKYQIALLIGAHEKKIDIAVYSLVNAREDCLNIIESFSKKCLM